MENAAKGSFSIPKNEGMLPKIIVVNLSTSCDVQKNTMCGNINEKHINLISLSTNNYIVLCVEMLKCITVNVLRVET